MKYDRNIIIKFSYLFLFVLTINSHSLFSQTRNTIWLDGLSTTSLGWDNTPNNFRDILGYDLENLVGTNTNPDATYQPGLGIEAASDRLSILINNQPNVLGIAHDFGGLILRDLANEDNTLTAIILDGVPNRGSSGIKFATDSNVPNGGLTTAQRIINSVQAIKSGEDCQDCQLVEIFEQWINEIAENESVYSEMASESVEVNILNENLPEIPYAVLWGSVDELSITSLMDSWSSVSGDGTALTDCYTSTLQRLRQEAEEDFEVVAAIDNSQGFFANAFNFIGALSSTAANPLSPTQFIGAVGDLVNSEKERTIEMIEAVTERERELARILRCELANQWLAVQWQLALIEQGSFTTDEITVPDMEFCGNFCSRILDITAFDAYADCLDECAANPSTPVGVSITVYVIDGNDGLLTRDEQQLGGAASVYHLEETNHFQETKLLTTGPGSVRDGLQELFDGAAGAAFIVPPQ